jgi:hypothetical protein
MDSNQSDNQDVDDNQDTEEQTQLMNEDDTEQTNTGEDDTEIEQTRDATQFTAGLCNIEISMNRFYIYSFQLIVLHIRD